MNFSNSIFVDKNKKVLCIGLLCLDMVSTCKKYPIEGTDQRCLSLRWQKGGNAANTSAVLGMLRQNVEYYGTVAHSEDSTENLISDFVISEMKKYNVCVDNVVVHDECKTPSSQVIINVENGSRTIVHSGQNLPELSIKHFLSLDHSKYCMIHFEGRNIDEVVKMMEFMNNYNKSASEDKKVFVSMEAEKPSRPNQVLMMPLADLVVVSQDFAESKNHRSAIDAVKTFKAYCKPGAFVVCAWGASGAACGIAGNDDDIVMVPAAVPNQVVDTLGAGDTFLGGLIHALVQEKNLIVAVQFACQIAGHKVSALGYNHIKGFSSAI